MKLVPLFLILILLVSCEGNASIPSNPTIAPAPQTSPASITAPAASTRLPASTSLVIGYFPDYRELNPQWGKYLTDIIYFSAEPRADGSLDTSRLTDDTLNQLHQMQAAYGTRIHISIGGWERGNDFAPMTASAETRKIFVDHLTAYLHENKLNGADFDWEFPQTEEEFQNYISLLNEIHVAFEPQGLILSVALPPEADFPLSKFTVVDRAHIMSYDHDGQHSTFEQAKQDLQLFLDAGLPPEKLVLGVPFYGRSISVFDREATYAEIMERFHPAPEVDEVNGIYFNNIITIQRKVCFTKTQAIAGIMIWELGQDTNDDTSLLKAIHQAACK